MPESCLATYREVFLATEFEKGGDEASVEAVKDGLINLFSKVTPTLSVIDDKSIKRKIERCRESVRRFRWNRLTSYQRVKFLENIDRIFNISKCQHKFRSCVDSLCNAENCKIKNLHLTCACLPLDKIPQEERAFMQDQMLRCTLGDKGRYQMSNEMMSKLNRRQAKRDQRKLEKRVEPEEALTEVVEDNLVVMEDINQNESKSAESMSDLSAEYKDDAVVRLERVKKRNWIPLTNLAREADRYVPIHLHHTFADKHLFPEGMGWEIDPLLTLQQQS